MGAAGLLGVTIPEEYGGVGAGYVAYGLVAREVERIDSGYRSMMSVQSSLVMYPIHAYGSEEQRRKYLPKLASGEWVGCFGLTEPDAGSDVAAMSTRFSKKGDTYVLNGRKRWITNADVANWYTVFAREQGTSGHRGIAIFVVDAGTPGLRWESMIHKLGQRASHTGDVVFEDVEVPAANLVAGPEHGFKLAMATFDRSRPWIAAGASGVIRRARDEALRYATERKTFGEPIVNHQMVAAMLADMEISYLATRLLCLYAASEVDRGNLRGSHSACAKAFGGDAAMKVTTDAVQIFGGYGYTQDFVVEKLMRDAKLLQIYEGTSQIQRLVISRDMVRTLGA